MSGEAVRALREAAEAARGMHDPTTPDCAEWADWLDARAAVISTNTQGGKCDESLRARIEDIARDLDGVTGARWVADMLRAALVSDALYDSRECVCGAIVNSRECSQRAHLRGPRPATPDADLSLTPVSSGSDSSKFDSNVRDGYAAVLAEHAHPTKRLDQLQDRHVGARIRLGDITGRVVGLIPVGDRIQARLDVGQAVLLTDLLDAGTEVELLEER